MALRLLERLRRWLRSEPSSSDQGSAYVAPVDSGPGEHHHGHHQGGEGGYHQAGEGGHHGGHHGGNGGGGNGGGGNGGS